ncbi:MAG: hypothetical protein A2857_03740 [Candidatus Levybacteria bacterium RIFCSPHIGHO2_01_FULL_36_15]|nr:MAG: hypothetical protein A2857_03740 [Candidatus Levybacteria bacterium RIFCSPHIGHO2_01_FULL_36_15]OGH37247.1 MAG: hypothetical protein A2905_06130 [Candidatus Levybacteria bacterium RIFCSPLOWO2_01_FULL_36_10]
MKKISGENKTCYLCGVNPANSADHVPPKNLFPKDYQVKGYKLPACSKCNNLLHLDEEYIRDRFSIAGQNDTAREVFQQGTRRSYLRPYEMLKSVTKLDLINRDTVPVIIKSPAGIHIGNTTGIKIDAKRVNCVSVKIIKGLYYHHLGQRIPDDYNFDAYFDPPNWLPDLLNKPSPLIGRFDEVFSYKGIVTKQDQATGIWWLSFYKSLGLIVVVENPTLAKEIKAQRETKHK